MAETAILILMSRRILLFLAAALLLIWLTAPAWLTWLVRNQLQQAGFSHVVCEIDQVGWSALHIRHLSAERNQAQIGIDATQLTVRYHPEELLQQFFGMIAHRELRCVNTDLRLVAFG